LLKPSVSSRKVDEVHEAPATVHHQKQAPVVLIAGSKVETPRTKAINPAAPVFRDALVALGYQTYIIWHYHTLAPQELHIVRNNTLDLLALGIGRFTPAIQRNGSFRWLLGWRRCRRTLRRKWRRRYNCCFWRCRRTCRCRRRCKYRRWTLLANCFIVLRSDCGRRRLSVCASQRTRELRTAFQASSSLQDARRR